MTRGLALLRGLGALILLVVLLVGVPVGLALLVGWPLPRHLPDWAQLRAALGSPIADTALLKALACAVWAAWASVAAAIFAEAAATVRGRTARRLPLAGGLQPLAGHLLAAVALAAASLSLRPAVPGPAAPLSVVLAAATHPTPVNADDLPAPLAPATSTPAGRVAAPGATTLATAAPAGRTYRVRRGDTLWGIAATQLGDPLRWREIYALNAGRPQPGGMMLSDPNDISAGWTLLLPAATLARPAAPPTAAGPAQRQAPPAGVADHPPPVVAAAPGADARPLHRQREAEPAESPQLLVPLRDARAPRAPSERQPAPPETPRLAPGPMVELPSGSTVALGLAAALSAALAAARLQRRRRQRPGRPHPGLTDTEPLAGPTVRRLRQAHLQALDTEDTPHAYQPAAGAGYPPRCVERVLATRPGQPPAGERNGAPLCLDLLAQPGIGLTGPGAPAAARALALGLLAENGAHRSELLATGAEATMLDRTDIPGLHLVADLHDALGRLEVELVQRTRILEVHRADTFPELLTAHPEEPLGPLVLLAVAPPASDQHRLATILSLGRRLGIGALLLGVWPAGTTLTVAADGTVEDAAGPAGQDLQHARLGTFSEAETGELAAVLVAAGGGEQPEPAAEPTETAVPAVTEPTMTVPGRPESEPVDRPVQVRVLGAVRVFAGGVEIDTGLRSKARELLAYLASRPDGVTDETVVEAIWPDAAPGRGVEQFHTAVGNLRKVLRQATGTPEAMFVERNAGRYQLDPDLIDVDLWRFQAQLARAQQHDDPGSSAQRGDALNQAGAAYGGDLAEDAPYEWAEALREQLRRQAVDALTDLAETRETSGDLPGALAAAQRALAVDPYAEAVSRQVMRLQARGGRRDAVLRTYRLLEIRLADLDTEPEPLTRQLLTELNHRQSPPGQPPGAPARAAPEAPVSATATAAGPEPRIGAQGGAAHRSSKP